MGYTTEAIVQTIETLAFVAVAAAAVRQWLQRPSRSTGWMLVAFGAVGLVVLTGAAVSQHQPPMWFVRLEIVLLVVFPFGLFRFARDLSRVRQWVGWLGCTATIALVVATLFVPDPGESKPWWLTAYLTLFLGTWTYLTVVSAATLWRGGKGHPTIIRRRVRMLAIGQLLINVALLGGQAGQSDAVRLTTLLIGTASGFMFLFAFLLPRWVRTVWRNREVEAFRDAQVALMATWTTDGVAAVVLPHAARMVGGSAAVFVDTQRRVVARDGISRDDADVLADQAIAACPAQGLLSREFAVVEMRQGWIIVRTSAYMPLFGPEELSLLQSLAHLVDLALERAILFEAEREALRQASERELQLAEAQHLAKVGSYEWDLAHHTAEWSREMYVIFGVSEGTKPTVELMHEIVHPDDRERVMAQTASTLHAPADLSIEYRIDHPSGEVRWVHGLGRSIMETDGQVRRIVGTIRDITEQKRVEVALAHQALHDPLTGLPNRLLLTDRLERSLARIRRTSRPLGVLFLDLDRFKVVNDAMGHSAGDELLRAVATRIADLLRPCDTVARLGGDEFVVLLDDLAGDQEAIDVASRIAGCLRRPISVADREVSVTASIGIVIADGEHQDADALLRDADSAMYRAKELGRARFELFDSGLREQLMERIDTERALGEAVARSQFELLYQPGVDMKTGQVVGMEALVRWNHPERGLLTPEAFVPLAEETGHIVPLGEWVLDEACAQARRWLSEVPGQEELVVWVNLSARQFRDADVTATVRAALARWDLPAGNLGLEITESVFMDNTERVGATFRELKSLGVRLAIDDFGTGFSSLGYLKRFPVDLLKIDRSFVMGLGIDREDDVLVSACVTLAHALGMSAIAEGVETPAHVAQLRALGCDQAQGYLLSRPITGAAASEILGRRLLAPARPRILVCDDDPSVRSVYAAALATEGADVVTAATGDECVQLAESFAPDLIVLDLSMPGHDGFWTLRELSGRSRARVLVVTACSAGDAFERALALGAEGLIDKVDFLDRMPDLVHPVAA